MEPAPTSLEVSSQQIWVLPKRSMSASSRPSVKAPPHSASKRLPVLSAGTKRTRRCATQLPVQMLRESLQFISAMHSLVEKPLVHKSKNSSATLSLVFERVKELLKESYLEGEEQWSLHSFCFKCGRRAGLQLKRCSGCGLVSFCSQYCKDDSWRSGHRLECSGSTHMQRNLAGEETKQKGD